MANAELERSVQPGDPAPDFTLPAVQREGAVSLGDYRGRSPLLVGLFRGLYCPFCRRHIAQLGLMSEKLRGLRVEMLGIVATNAERARLYLRYHPARLPLAADPACATHRAYGLPQMELTPELLQMARSLKINPTGELPAPMDPIEASEALNRLDRFEMTKTDEEDNDRHGFLFVGQFLVDQEGILRWANVECAKDGPAGFGKFPNEEELLAAARGL